MAAELIALGHTVFGCGRSAEAIERLRNEFDLPHEFVKIDVTQAAEVQEWADELLDLHGPPDFLVNNAGLINPNAPLWEISENDFNAVIDVNLKGVANVIRAFVPAMVERGRGVIVNFSSYWGRSPAPEVAPYCATKWAIEGLTRALAQELPSGMAAVPFNPGIIDTDMLRSTFGAQAGSYPSPEDWAKTAVPFLLQLGPKQNGQAVTAP